MHETLVINTRFITHQIGQQQAAQFFGVKCAHKYDEVFDAREQPGCAVRKPVGLLELRGCGERKVW
eukprot:3987526-Pyramimonas_sp.AAC.1